MTMIDDHRLAALFTRAGDAFDVPTAGAADILERALGTADTTIVDDDADPAADATISPLSRPRRAVEAARAHRLLSVAASLVVIVLVAGAIGIGLSGSKAPVTTASAPALHPGPLLGGATTTTTPGSDSNGFSAASGTGSTTGAASAGTVPLNALPQTGAAASAPTAASPAPGPSSALPSGSVGQSSKIEQTGNLGLTVAKGALGKTMTELTYLASLYDGFVATSQTQSGADSATGMPNGSITLEVPVGNFANVLKKAQSFGKTSDLTTKATDVTGQYVDLQSRLTALQASRQQYLTIMAKATSVGDVLAVQAQLDTIQSEIEQLQGQLQLLTSQTAYSTLNVTVSEGAPPVHHKAPHHQSGLSKSWHDSVQGFVNGVEGLIRVAGPLLFALLCLGALIVGGRLLWRRYERHNL